MGLLDGRAAIVTGSSSGIGEAVARSLAAQGAGVVVNSSSSVERGQAVAADLPDAVYVRADVGDEAGAAALVEAARSRWGRLDVLVNNAGTTVKIPHGDLDAVTPEVWQRILGVNVVGTWTMTRAAVPLLRESGAGCVVNVGSLAGERPLGSSIPYAVSKAAVHHLTRLLAAALAPAIRVNAVAPGLIATPWTSTPEWEAEHQFWPAMAPLGRVGTPEDVAATVLGLVSSPFVTGEVVLVDAGMHLR